MFIYSALSDIYTHLQPLHIAVKLGHIRLVKLIVEFSKSSVLMLDVDGQTTLHAAVKLCYAQITSILLAAADPKGLQMENGVGITPIDIISLSKLSSRIEGFPNWNTMFASELKIDGVEPFYRYPGEYIQKMQKELPKLHAILEILLAEGKLKKQKKSTKELIRFASTMKERLSEAEAVHAARLARVPKEEEASDPKDRYDLEKTSSIISGALKGSTVNRQLIHLIDVQKSVGADLEKVDKRLSDESQRRRKWKGKGELDAEQDDEEEEEKAQSMVWQYTAQIYADSI